MASFTPWRRMSCRLCHVHEISPGTHTFFPTYTCPVYCWRSVQLLDFRLFCNLIHASQPIRATFTGQWFASGFLQTPSHGGALAIGCTLPTAGRARDFHPLERAPAGRIEKQPYSRKNTAVWDGKKYKGKEKFVFICQSGKLIATKACCIFLINKLSQL